MEQSKCIAGTMLWGSWGRKWDTKYMSDCIYHFINSGIFKFDHADIYGDYTTEEQFGAAFKQSGISRTDIQLITKCGIKRDCQKRPYQLHHYDYSEKYILESCNQSLKNLQTDYIDIYLLHRPSPLMHSHEIAAAITKLMGEGKIREFGVSNFSPLQTELIKKLIPVKYNQIEFSLAHHIPLTDGSLDYMMTNSIQPMAWSPLGKILKTNSNKEIEKIYKVVETLGEKYNTETKQILLAWILKHPAHIWPVVGTTNFDRISQLKSLSDFTLSDEDWFLLWTTAMGQDVP